MPGSPRKERGESPQTGAKPGATQATAVTLGSQAAFWNLSLAVRKALISDEWREKEWWRGGASQAAFWNLSLAVWPGGERTRRRRSGGMSLGLRFMMAGTRVRGVRARRGT